MANLKKLTNGKKKRLNNLLSKSLTPKLISRRYPTLNKSVTAAGSFQSCQTALEAVKASHPEEKKKKVKKLFRKKKTLKENV